MKKRSQLKGKINFWLLNFHKEIKKTTEMGKKMLTASRINTQMKDTYEELGKLLEKGVDSGEVDWDSPKLRALLYDIKACKKDLEEIEQAMNNIKFSGILPQIEYKPDDIDKDKAKEKNKDKKDG